MIVKPRVKGFICITSHPAGCHHNIQKQIQHVQSNGEFAGPKNVLIIGASTGYGLASRIVSAFGNKAKTLAVFFERPGKENKPASAGYYNTLAFEKECEKSSLYCKHVNGDAFSKEVKAKVVETIKKDLGKVDLVIYSLASPKRLHPDSGVLHSSVLKPIGQSFTSKTIDANKGIVREIEIDKASEEEIANTIEVMGGDDWYRWMETLSEAHALEEHVSTYAYSYIGPSITYPIYRQGTIGRAKEDLEKTTFKIKELLAPLKGEAYVSVNKALVTQSSSAIPVVPLYIALLYQVMKKQGTNEGCIEQMYRLYKNHITVENKNVDAKGLIRIDDLEMDAATQKEVADLWGIVTTENVYDISDLKGYQREFLSLFGFECEGVDYEMEQNIGEQLKNLV